MKIERIITNRDIDPKHANDLVYEWEDQMVEAFQCSLHQNHPWHNQRYSKWLPWLLSLIQTNKPSFTYEMCTFRHAGNNKRNILPCIIDYYLRKPWQVRFFLWTYSRNPKLMISSREAYEFLLPFVRHQEKLVHLPLSLADKYRITADTHYDKTYDVILVGRQNPVLKNFLNTYFEQHPGLKVVSVKMVDGIRYFYCGDERLGESEGRDNYVQMTRRCKVALYATPGIDGATNTNGFSQVTPRYLEFLAFGCHILGRYPDNADTRYFELSRFVSNIQTQSEFDSEMDRALSTEVDMADRAAFLQKHYTSVRIEILKQILATIQ